MTSSHFMTRRISSLYVGVGHINGVIQTYMYSFILQKSPFDITYKPKCTWNEMLEVLYLADYSYILPTNEYDFIEEFWNNYPSLKRQIIKAENFVYKFRSDANPCKECGRIVLVNERNVCLECYIYK